MGLQKKLFRKQNKKEVKALTEAKGSNTNSNTRTSAMVLRSERELLNANEEQELEIAQLKLTLEEKNREVEKLKDLCLKQREEIRSLKDAILFPDVMNSQLQNVLEKQGSELKQAKRLIPGLQRQVASLTGQLQWLADDLAEVKADKYGRALLMKFNFKLLREKKHGYYFGQRKKSVACAQDDFCMTWRYYSFKPTQIPDHLQPTVHSLHSVHLLLYL